MITVTKLSGNPPFFLSLTGMTVWGFQELVARMKKHKPGYEKGRLGSPGRQRKIGGGRKFACVLEEQLLMLLLRYRLGLKCAVLGALFEVTGATACRNVRYVIPLYKKFHPLPGRMISPCLENARKELSGLCPDMEIAADTPAKANYAPTPTRLLRNKNRILP